MTFLLDLVVELGISVSVAAVWQRRSSLFSALTRARFLFGAFQSRPHSSRSASSVEYCLANSFRLAMSVPSCFCELHDCLLVCFTKASCFPFVKPHPKNERPQRRPPPGQKEGGSWTEPGKGDPPPGRKEGGLDRNAHGLRKRSIKKLAD